MLDRLALCATLVMLLWGASRAIYSVGFRPALRTAGTRGPLGRVVFHALMFPGTVVHEMSHWLVCKITLVKVHEFVPYRPQPDGTLGWVLHDRADPLRGLLIAVAPTLGGTLVLVNVATYLAPSLAAPPRASGPEELAAAFVTWLPRVFADVDWLGWRAWVLVYLGATIGRGMLPSRNDLAPALGAIAGAMLALAGLYSASDWWQNDHVVAPILLHITTVALAGVERIAGGLSIAVVALLVATAIVVPLGTAVGGLTGTRMASRSGPVGRGRDSGRK